MKWKKGQVLTCFALATISVTLAAVSNLQAVLFAAAALFWWNAARREWRNQARNRALAREALRARLLGRRAA